MSLKYEKPKIIPFNSDRGETGMGICNNGTAESGGNCTWGGTASLKCNTGGNASGWCQSGTVAAGKCSIGDTP